MMSAGSDHHCSGSSQQQRSETATHPQPHAKVRRCGSDCLSQLRNKCQLDAVPWGSVSQITTSEGCKHGKRPQTVTDAPGRSLSGPWLTGRSFAGESGDADWGEGFGCSAEWKRDPDTGEIEEAVCDCGVAFVIVSLFIVIRWRGCPFGSVIS